jgi:hypothetical protein
VLLSPGITKLPMDSAQRDLPIHYLTGPANRPYDDPTYVKQIWPTEGVALKPYRPAHLKASMTPDGALAIRWIRRTRVDGDTWAGLDVPVSEAREAYQVVVRRAETTLATYEVTTQALTLSAAQVAEFGLSPGDEIRVSQLSDRYGLGTPAVVVLP